MLSVQQPLQRSWERLAFGLEPLGELPEVDAGTVAPSGVVALGRTPDPALVVVGVADADLGDGHHGWITFPRLGAGSSTLGACVCC